MLEELGIGAQRTQAFEVADGRRIERHIGDVPAGPVITAATAA